MSELNEAAPTQAEIDDLLNPDYLSGRQREALRRLDEKNIDRADLVALLQGALDAYNRAKTIDA